MIRIITFISLTYGVFGYFTVPGKCPENVRLQENFRLEDFYGKWYQAYHYSSDLQSKNNCSTLELKIGPLEISLNQSRVDRGLFHRYSIGRFYVIPIGGLEKSAAELEITFHYKNAPRRLEFRKYPFHVLATNYNYYATVYTCSYSPLIDKHFIYVWILSRRPTLNEVSKELAIGPLQQLGVDSSKLVKEDFTKCNPKYYEDVETEPMTFRYPVPV